MPLSSTFDRSSRGFASVEFVIVTPVLVFLIFAIAEIGRAFIQYATLANAVRNSVRFVAGEAISGSTGVIDVDGTLRNQGQNLVAYGRLTAGTPLLPGLTPGQVTVSAPGAGNVTVSAVYPYTPIVGPTLPTFGITQTPISLVFNLTVTSTMQALP
jgi:Flp pilus assembly protein TadG